MESCKKLIASCFIGRGRSTIAVVLVMLIAIGLVAPPPAKAQIGALGVAAAAAAVVSLITNTIGALLGTANGLLGSINNFFQALVNLWENIVYPIALINQARMLVTQLIAQFRGLVTAIDNVNVRSATLPNPSALEVIMRNGSIADFAPVQPDVQDDLPAASAGDRYRSRRPPAGGHERRAGDGHAEDPEGVR